MRFVFYEMTGISRIQKLYSMTERKGVYMSDKYEDEVTLEEDCEDQEDHKHEPEKFCTLCRRSERQAGRMIDLPNNIHICSDCMQIGRASCRERV